MSAYTVIYRYDPFPFICASCVTVHDSIAAAAVVILGESGHMTSFGHDHILETGQ